MAEPAEFVDWTLIFENLDAEVAKTLHDREVAKARRH